MVLLCTIFGSINLNMINFNIMKRFVFIRILFFGAFLSVSFSLLGQKGADDGSKYGHGDDSIRCVRNLSLYREFTRHRDYDIAYPYWKITFHECPTASKNIYLDGAKIIKHKLEKTEIAERKNELLDTLMLIYERRMEYFKEKGNVRGRQGVDLLKYGRGDLDNVKEAYAYLKESIELRKTKTSDPVLVSFVSTTIVLYQNNLIEANKTIEDYLLVSSIIDKNIQTKPNRKGLQEIKLSVDDAFVKDGPGNCDTLISYFAGELTSKQESIEFLRMLTSLLRNRDCTESDLFYKASKNLHNLSPSSESALNIAILAFNSNNYHEAAEYYQQALNLETTEEKKADYYFGLAACYSELNTKLKARNYALKAHEVRPDWGEPFILIGQLYASSKFDCSSLSLPNSIYWIAVDMFIKAKKIDASVQEKANKLILSYSNYFPDKEEAFFQDVTEGKNYTIGCWINETTTARFND